MGRSTLTLVTSLPWFTSSVPGLIASIDAGLWLSVGGERQYLEVGKEVVRTSESIKVPLWEGLAPLRWWLALAGLEGL